MVISPALGVAFVMASETVARGAFVKPRTRGIGEIFREPRFGAIRSESAAWAPGKSGGRAACAARAHALILRAGDFGPHAARRAAMRAELQAVADDIERSLALLRRHL